MKKRMVYIFLGLFLFAWSCTKSTEQDNLTDSEKAEPVNTCVVTMLKGSVILNEDSGSASLSVGDSLSENDRINVGEDSIAELLIGDSSVVRIKENSVVAITTLFKDEEAEKTGLFLETGKMLAHPEEQNEMSSFEVATDTVVVGVRGTEFTLIKDDDISKVAVTEGEVKVKNNIKITALEDVEAVDEEIARTIEEEVNPEIVLAVHEKIELSKSEVEVVQQKIEKEVEEIARVLEKEISEEKNAEEIAKIKKEIREEIKEEKFKEIKKEVKQVFQKEKATEQELEEVFDKEEFKEIEIKATKFKEEAKKKKEEKKRQEGETEKKEKKEKKEKEKKEKEKKTEKENQNEAGPDKTASDESGTEEEEELLSTLPLENEEPSPEEQKRIQKYMEELEKSRRLMEKGKRKEAVTLARTILKQAQEEAGEFSVVTGQAYFNLAMMLREEGDRSVEDYFKKAIDIQEKEGSNDDPSLCFMYNGYSGYLAAERKVPLAMDFLEKSLALAEERLDAGGGRGVEYKRAMVEAFTIQANIFREEDEPLQAAQLYKKALNTFEKENLKDVHLKLDILENYKEALKRGGKEGEAAEVEKKIETLFKDNPRLNKGPGRREEEMARQMEQFEKLFQEAFEYADAGRKNAALDLAEDTLEKAKKETGGNSMITARAYSNLGTVLMRFDKDIDLSRKYITAAVKIYEKSDDLNDPTLVFMLTDLGELAVREDKMGEAKRFYDRAKGEADKRLNKGPENRSEHLHAKAIALTGLGRVAMYEEKDKEAERLLKDALRLAEQALGRNHFDLIPILEELKELMRLTGKRDEMNKIEKRMKSLEKL